MRTGYNENPQKQPLQQSETETPPKITNGLFPNWARTLPHPDPPTNPFGSGATGQKNTSLDKVYLLRDRCCPTFGSDGTVASGEARGMKV